MAASEILLRIPAPRGIPCQYRWTAANHSAGHYVVRRRRGALVSTALGRIDSSARVENGYVEYRSWADDRQTGSNPEVSLVRKRDVPYQDSTWTVTAFIRS